MNLVHVPAREQEFESVTSSSNFQYVTTKFLVIQMVGGMPDFANKSVCFVEPKADEFLLRIDIPNQLRKTSPLVSILTHSLASQYSLSEHEFVRFLRNANSLVTTAASNGRSQ